MLVSLAPGTVDCESGTWYDDAGTRNGEPPWHRVSGMVSLLASWTGGTGDSEPSRPAWHPAVHMVISHAKSQCKLYARLLNENLYNNYYVLVELTCVNHIFLGTQFCAIRR